MAEIQRQHRAATRRAAGGVTTHGAPVNASVAQSTSSFPRAGLASKTPEGDQRLATKMQFTKDGMSPFGQVMATDADFRLIEQKRKLEEEAQYDKWLGENFHKGDVAARKWLQDTVPEYYEVREREIDERADFAATVAKLKLRGPRNTKEMILLYGLMEGKIKLDPGWNVIGYVDQEAVDDAGVRKNRFTEKLAGPFRWTTPAERETRAKNPTNPFRNEDITAPVAGLSGDATTDFEELFGQFS